MIMSKEFKERMKLSDIFKTDLPEEIDPMPELKLDYESTMKYIHNRWVDEATKNGDYPSEVLIPVKAEDIIKSKRPEYTSYIEKKYREACSRDINDIFKDK